MQTWSRTKATDVIFVSVITLIGLIIRLPALRLGYWRDEGSTYFDVAPNSLAEVVHQVIYTELSPPGFFILMHGWLHTVDIDGVLFKIPVLVIGVLLIPAVFILASSLGSRPIAFTAALIAMIAPEAITYSQEVRPQILAAFLAALTAAAYCKMLDTMEVKPWVLSSFVASATAVLYVQYTGALLVFAFMLFSAYLVICGRAQFRPHAIAFGAIFALFLPWLPVMLDHRDVGIPGADKVHLWNVPFNFLNNLVILFPAQGVHRIMSAFVVLLVLAGMVYAIRGVKSNSDLKLLALVGAMTFVALFEAVFVAPVPRYLFIVAPFAWTIIALVVVSVFRWAFRLRNFASRALVIGCLAVILAVGGTLDLQYSLALGDQPKSGVPALISFLQAKKLQPSFYVITPDYLASSVGYYTRNDPAVRLYGFARWDHPQISTFRGEAEVWSSAAILSEAEAHIRGIPRKNREVFAIVAKEGMVRNGKVDFEKSNALVSDLLKQYHVVDYKRFPGRYESVVLYLLR